MAIFTGSSGSVEIMREGDNDQPFPFVLKPDFVNTTKHLFSYSYDTFLSPRSGDEVPPFLIGDRVQIRNREYGEDVVLIAGDPKRVIEGYIWTNAAGQFRLYRTFDDAVNHSQLNYYKLEKHSEDQELSIEQVDGRNRCLAQVLSYEFVTERESVDVTTLGNDFREKHTRGLIAGQGTLNCIWEYEQRMCEDNENKELPNFLVELAQRVTFGAEFIGTFILHQPPDIDGKYVWQEAHCIVTNAAVTVAPNQILTTTIQFVTTGGFALRVGYPKYAILLDGVLRDAGALLGEDGEGVMQEQPDD